MGFHSQQSDLFGVIVLVAQTECIMRDPLPLILSILF